LETFVFDEFFATVSDLQKSIFVEKTNVLCVIFDFFFDFSRGWSGIGLETDAGNQG
jgi:hypothetical protein